MDDQLAPETRAREPEANLKCLQECVENDPVFKRDLRMLAKGSANADAKEHY